LFAFRDGFFGGFRGFSLVAFFFKDGLQYFSYVLVIVDDEDSGLFLRAFSPPSFSNVISFLTVRLDLVFPLLVICQR